MTTPGRDELRRVIPAATMLAVLCTFLILFWQRW